MSSPVATVATAPRLSGRNRVGLVLAALLGVVDVVSLAITPNDPDQAGPPVFILAIATVLGVVTLVAVVLAWRTHRRAGSRIVAVTRILSALTALPAFFVPDVPTALVAAAAATLLTAAVSVYLVLGPAGAADDR